MKTGLLTEITRIILLLAVPLSFLPLIIYWWKRLAENKAYMVIAIYWMVNGILYLPDIFHWNWYEPITLRILILYNLIDAPIIFLVFYYAFGKKVYLYGILAFFAFEAIIIAWKGFNLVSNNIIIAGGSLLCLLLNIRGIIQYLKKVKHTDQEIVLIFVFAAFTFYYGLIFDILLISRYLKPAFMQEDSIMLLNYIAIFVATILISIGFIKFARPSENFISG